MVERCALSGSDLKVKFRTILLTSIKPPAFVDTHCCCSSFHYYQAPAPIRPLPLKNLTKSNDYIL